MPELSEILVNTPQQLRIALFFSHPLSPLLCLSWEDAQTEWAGAAVLVYPGADE